jgi:DNA mismatch repair protein MutS
MKEREFPEDALNTPVMRQYCEVKKNYPDAILFFRMGDFYEMFLDDARIAAPILDVALTRRQNQIPMAGIPYHSADTYIARLLAAGKKIAIAEQSEDPANPKLMRRTVRRVVSPGTVIEESLLSTPLNNFLMAIVPGRESHGIALADVSTGEFFSTRHDGPIEDLRDYYYRYTPCEIIVSTSALQTMKALLPEIAEKIVPVEDWRASPSEGLRLIESEYGISPRGLGYESDDGFSPAAVALAIHYIRSSFPESGIRMDAPAFRPQSAGRMFLDAETIRNLDLVWNQHDGGSGHTLFHVLDSCQTGAGRRFLKDAILHPLTERSLIEKRIDCVRALIEPQSPRVAIRGLLDGTSDLDRILSRLSSGRAAPRDFVAIAGTVRAFMELRNLIRETPLESLIGDPPTPEECVDYSTEVARIVVDDPPAIFGNAPFVRDGIDERLDRSREAIRNGSEWILKFEDEERKRTGLSTLRVKYNRVVGYFIEMSRVQAADAPAEYRRKQTLVGNERFTCERLEELEIALRDADEVVSSVEQGYFSNLREGALKIREGLRTITALLAIVDFIASLADVAGRHRWIQPAITEERACEIVGGRHPVVEQYLPPGTSFVPNDLRLDDTRFLALITGPNMAGKSTYIRQAALIQLLMQIGSFVPAARCTLPIADGIFTRIGASDHLTRGESTFFMEMLETARILNRCTGKSLVIMDEVGRGTSTYDGLSIAWAIVEHLAMETKPRTLFATHYHELTRLQEIEGVFNLTVEILEREGKITFLHRVREGSADRSYGIHVAKLAGLPERVILRANEKLAELESPSATPVVMRERGSAEKIKIERIPQPTLFSDIN